MVPIENAFENKIVYTTDAVADLEPYINDCKTKGGVLNECGNPCSPDAEFCIEVCALTCEYTEPKLPHEDSFKQEIQDIALERMGQPIEGFDAYLLKQGLPGLTDNDFAGVKNHRSIDL